MSRLRTTLWVLVAVAGASGLALMGTAAIQWMTPVRSVATQPPATQPPAGPTLGDDDDPASAQRQPGSSIVHLADPTWVRETATTAGIPERAMAAYAGAALAVQQRQPQCGLGWNTLAAIGHVESEHGTIDGSALDPDGVASPAIIGVALDGDGVDVIRDTDDGELDGDTEWDRAIGPMQFIPATWELFASDGNGDGITDPHQIDDSALAAALYLCSVSGTLADDASWIAAIGAYNSSIDYNHRVAAAATHFATLP